MVCLCFKHTNFALKLKALGIALPRFDDVDSDHFVEKYEAKDVDALLHNITHSVTLSEWKRIQMEIGYKICFATQDVSAADFKNKLSQEYPVFVKHKELVTNQHAMVHEIKGTLNEDTCTVQMDFAKHFVSTHGEEIQPAYFDENSVTLYPIVVHYKRNVQDEDNEEALECLSYVAIVDDRAHNASYAFAILQHFIHILKKISQASDIFIILQIRQRVSIEMSPSQPCC